MFAVIFEVEPRAERWDEYLDIAKSLKPELERVDGFIDNERFVSKRNKKKVLSLSTWRDEKSLIRWRALAVHHRAQEKGRFEVFSNYHLRVGEIVADDHVPRGHTLRQTRFDETEIAAAKAITLTEFMTEGDRMGQEDGSGIDAGPAQSRNPVSFDIYESIYQPGKTVLVSSWHDVASAEPFQLRPSSGASVRHRLVRVIRDYGMFDRREAPQYYAEPLAGQ